MKVGEKEKNAKYMKEKKRVKMMKKREMELEVGDEEDDGRRKARGSG
jgi:hypothetical protein